MQTLIKKLEPATEPQHGAVGVQVLRVHIHPTHKEPDGVRDRGLCAVEKKQTPWAATQGGAGDGTSRQALAVHTWAIRHALPLGHAQTRHAPARNNVLGLRGNGPNGVRNGKGDAGDGVQTRIAEGGMSFLLGLVVGGLGGMALMSCLVMSRGDE